MRNHAAEPLGKVGINYDLQDGAGLDLPELGEPDDHGRHYIERSGSPTRLTFKKIDWKEVIWKDEQGIGLWKRPRSVAHSAKIRWDCDILSS